MCGLVYSKDFTGKPVNGWVAEQFKKQRSRGFRGFGFYNADKKSLVKTPKEHKILKNLRRNSEESSHVLFHHRLPTSTENVANACHPFTTKNFFKTEYILAHNGVISKEKATKCKEKHEKMGIVYTSTQPDGKFNDSEALLWEVALYLEGKQDKLEAGGTIAFICLAVKDKETKLYFGRNYGNPLRIELKEEQYVRLASELPLNDSETVDADQLYCLDMNTRELTKTKLDIPSSYSYSYNNKSYTHSHTHNQSTSAPFMTSRTTKENIKIHSFQKGNRTQNEVVAEVPAHVLNSTDDMVWDEDSQTLWMQDQRGDWSTWDEIAAEYAEKQDADMNEKLAALKADVEEDEELDISFLDDEEETRERNIIAMDISVVLAKSDGITAKTNIGARQIDVRKRYTEYMKANAGNFQLAYMDVCKDLEWLQDQLALMTVGDEEVVTSAAYKDLAYEVSITQSICDGLIINPDWDDSASVAKGYENALDAEELPITDSGLKAFRKVQDKVIEKIGGKKWQAA